MIVNVLYNLEEHGWSTCWIVTKKDHHEITITHIFDNPIENCIRALNRLIKGEKKATFNWYGEPGGNQIVWTELPNERHKVHFKIIGFYQEYGDVPDNIEYTGDLIAEFQIKKNQLIKMFYFEFKKTFELLKDTNFKQNRISEFPIQAFLDFEKLATEYLSS